MLIRDPKQGGRLTRTRFPAVCHRSTNSTRNGRICQRTVSGYADRWKSVQQSLDDALIDGVTSIYQRGRFMAKAADIIATMAHVAGCSVEDLTEIARRVREGGYWVRETRSPNSPRATCRQCANLVAALLSGEPARHAARGVERLANTIISQESMNHLEQCAILPGPLSQLWKGEHSFIDALEILFEAARNNPSRFSRYKSTSIEVSHLTYEGTIVLNGYDLLNDEDNISVTLHFWNPETFHFGDLEISSRISSALIAEVGKLLAKP